MSTANLQQRLNDLFGYIRQGKIIEAMNEFYAKDTKMQENAHLRMEQVAVARWKNGKIVHERFYYDTGTQQ